MMYDHDLAVREELARRWKSNAKTSDKASWKDQHTHLAEQYGVQWPLEVPDQLEKSEWFHVLPAREKEAQSVVLKLNTHGHSHSL